MVADAPLNPEPPPPWPHGGDPDPWAMGECGLRGCWCSEEARAAIALAAARLLASVEALAAEQDPEVSPLSATASRSLLRTTAELWREAPK